MNNELFKPLNTKSKITVMYHLGNFYTYPTMKNTKLNLFILDDMFIFELSILFVTKKKQNLD
jgi:hypothetical protein